MLSYQSADPLPLRLPLSFPTLPIPSRRFRTTFAALFATPAYISSGLPLGPAPGSPAPGTEGERDPPVLYSAIVQKDSSVVYYRIAKGVEKPHDVPE